MKIEQFTGEWGFLSNFHASPITIEGVVYPTVEHAFQAGKTLDTDQRLAVSKCRTAAEAKQMGRTVTLRTDWDTVRVKVMTRLVSLKFRDPQLLAQLLATEGKELIEGNYWNDRFWGVCRGQGENHLGKILMLIRAAGSTGDCHTAVSHSQTEREQSMEMITRKYYAGIGSRSTPLRMQRFMTKVATWMESQGWTLRSGGAEAADSAFESGVHMDEDKQIFLPWRGFNGNNSPRYSVGEDAMKVMRQFHPAPFRLSQGAAKLHGRNSYQVLGPDLQTHSKVVICWTEGGLGQGGTGQAIRIARFHGIPVYDLGDPKQLAKIETKIGIRS